MTVTQEKTDAVTPPVPRGHLRLAHVGVGVLAFLVTAALLSWSLARPAFWIDESATVAATRRSWGQLWPLFRGAEAPLMPYYLVLKPLAALGSAAGLPLEAQYRWPSVVAVALGAGFLTAWLYRRFGAALAAASLAVLLLTAAVSRYGQEARPYPFTALFAVLSTIAWFRLREPGSNRRRWAVLYAVALGVLACLHLLAVTLLFAHLLAAAVLGATRPDRVRDVRWTLGAAALGGVITSPFTLLGARYAKGPSTSTPISAQRLWDTFVQAFTWFNPFLGVGWLLLLAFVGVFALALRRYRTIAVVALCWAVVPLAVLVPAMLVRPTLLRLRYLVFVVPGWAILGGLGVVVIAHLVFLALARVPSAARVAAVAAGVVVVVALGFTQWASLTRLREPDGHGEDVRPALAYVEAHPGLPIMISGRTPGSLLAAYAPGLGARLLGAHLQFDQRTIWPVVDPVAQRREMLRGHDEVMVLVRNTLDNTCRRKRREGPKAFMGRCMPQPLAVRGYRVVSTGGIGGSYEAGIVRLRQAH